MYDNFLIYNINVLEQQLRDLETKTWKENDGNKPKLRLYKEFKRDKDREKYLELNMYGKERSVLEQFLLGCLCYCHSYVNKQLKFFLGD